ncbi:hypothetical protein FHT00_000442 [Sphingomonas insulae]|uniref:Uncharacterized protein n=1 Tax=Sphingomonas insulae TaxID=424800 RepID=A0ABP3SY59_9SPHN|nr:hypothetical protein [Sphingomonas insulae]NIJ28514.1 hypothetical protein [Sphingomonas insulae]
MSPVPRYAAVALPVTAIVALVAAAALAVAMPGGRCSDALALFASVAALCAAQERRTQDMILATGLAVGLAPAGLLLAPLCVGIAIRRGAARTLPIGASVAIVVSRLLPWPTLAPTLPNLAAWALVRPDALALVAAIGIGMAAWLGARASTPMPGALLAEARLGVVLLACVLPLPLGVLGIVVVLAALPLPARPRLQAANDNRVLRRTVRLAA